MTSLQDLITAFRPFQDDACVSRIVENLRQIEMTPEFDEAIVNQLRTDCQALVGIQHKRLADLAYSSLLFLAIKWPINPIDPFTQDEIEPSNMVVISTGHQFDKEALGSYVKTEGYRKLKNPFDRSPISERDKAHIAECTGVPLTQEPSSALHEDDPLTQLAMQHAQGLLPEEVFRVLPSAIRVYVMMLSQNLFREMHQAELARLIDSGCMTVDDFSNVPDVFDANGISLSRLCLEHADEIIAFSRTHGVTHVRFFFSDFYKHRYYFEHQRQIDSALLAGHVSAAYLNDARITLNLFKRMCEESKSTNEFLVSTPASLAIGNRYAQPNYVSAIWPIVRKCANHEDRRRLFQNAVFFESDAHMRVLKSLLELVYQLPQNNILPVLQALSLLSEKETRFIIKHHMKISGWMGSCVGAEKIAQGFEKMSELMKLVEHNNDADESASLASFYKASPMLQTQLLGRSVSVSKLLKGLNASLAALLACSSSIVEKVIRFSAVFNLEALTSATHQFFKSTVVPPEYHIQLLLRNARIQEEVILVLCELIKRYQTCVPYSESNLKKVRDLVDSVKKSEESLLLPSCHFIIDEITALTKLGGGLGYGKVHQALSALSSAIEEDAVLLKQDSILAPVTPLCVSEKVVSVRP